MAEKKRKQSKEQLRNLYQYKNLSDVEFEKMWEAPPSKEVSSDFEDRIEKKLKEFSQDYDIDDLKINDKETLRAFLQAIIALEDYESKIFDIRTNDDITQSNINVVDRLSGVCSNLRKDISKFQDDLNITRKLRKSDRESSVVSYIGNLKEQARQYFESKMSYIICPGCGMLLGNIWTLYPEAKNEITLQCQSILDDGSVCNTKVVVTTAELKASGGSNRPVLTPDSLL